MVQKLKSERGATLSMALLLFLVCVVVSSVVLVSGTAAAGRVSGLSRMDQRYYSVQSAVALLCGELSDDAAPTQEVVRTRALGATLATLDAAPPPGSLAGALTNLAVFGTAESPALGTAVSWDNGSEPEAAFSLEVPGHDGLSVAAHASFAPAGGGDRTVDLDVYNSNGDASAYHVHVVVQGTVSEGLRQNTVAVTDDEGVTTEVPVSETKTTTVTWTVSDVRGPGEV